MTKRPDPKNDPVPQAPGKPPANESDSCTDELHNPELRFQ